MPKKIIETAHAPAPIGPYNQATLAHGTLYISGQIALDAETGQLVLGSIEAETEQVLNNLGAILEAAGLTYRHVVKCSVFVTDMALFARINAVYARYFDESWAPARELVQVAALPRYVNVEISAIAVS
jgi:2-iminobutanoate/2-iminopropanoate deaminase